MTRVIPRSPRRALRKFGRIIAESWRDPVACVILNLSETGALLFVDGKVPPRRFQLLLPNSNELKAVEVVRRENKVIGVKFL